MKLTREEALERLLGEYALDAVLSDLENYGTQECSLICPNLDTTSSNDPSPFSYTIHRFSTMEVLRAHVARLQEKAKVADFREIFDRNRERIYAENPTPRSTRVGEIKGSVVVPDTED